MDNATDRWKRMTMMERRRVLDALKKFEQSSADGRAFGVAYDLLQEAAETHAAHSEQALG